MLVTAKDINDGTGTGGQGCDEQFGHGLVQAKAALEFLRNNPCSQKNYGSKVSLGGCNNLG